MQSSRLSSSLLVSLGIVGVGIGVGCSSEPEITQVMIPGMAGSSTTAAGNGSGGSADPGTAGTGGSADPGTAGSAPQGGSDTNGQAGSAAMAGTGGAPEGGSGGGGGAAGGGGMGGSGGADPEANKIVLFDGSAESFSGWVKRNGGGANPWKNNPDKTMTVQTGTGDIISKQTFQDVFVHVEYKTPMLPAEVQGQERGNSGVYLKSSYEMQVLDTYGKPPALDGCGALYGIRAPSVVACFQHEQWNTYEIEFKAQVCNEQGQKTANAKFVKVTLNGMVVHENVEAPNQTEAGLPENCMPRGLLLQDHSSVQPVSYRNIWVIPRDRD